MIPHNHISPTNPQNAFSRPVQILYIHQKLWIFLLVLTTFLVLTLLWVREYVLNLSLARIFPFVYAYLGLFIIFRKGKKRGVQNIEDVCIKQLYGAESSSYIRDDLKLHWWEYWLCKSLFRMTWYMQHSKDNVWFGRVGDFRKRKQDARTDKTCMLFCQIICKSERHLACKVQLFIEQLP